MRSEDVGELCEVCFMRQVCFLFCFCCCFFYELTFYARKIFKVFLLDITNPKA